MANQLDLEEQEQLDQIKHFWKQYGNAITWVLIAEIFPLRMRAQGMAVAVFVNWGCNYLVSLTFLDLVNIIGSALTFFLYAVICVAAFLFTLFFIPETKGLTSEEIQKRLKRTPV